LAHLKAAAGNTGARAVEELAHLKAAAGETGARAVEELAMLKAAAGVKGARAVAAAGERGARMLKAAAGAAAGEKNVEELGVASVKAITELSRRARGLAVGTLPMVIAAAFCTAMSTAFHVFWCMSPEALRIFGQLDFMGIAVLCAGHAWTGVFYAFYCSPTIRNRYFAAILISLLTSMNVIMSSKFRAKDSRTYRAAVFSCLGASIVVPVIHSGILHEWKHDAYPTFAVWMVAAGISYLIGVILYASRVPECCRPGKHDGWWSSHQLMHCAVIIGASFHTYGCHLLISYRIERGCAFSPLKF